MAPFTPFMQSTQAQGIIDSYLNGDYKAQPNVNSAGNFRNPFFDLRTEQENAGTLDPSALYPNPQLDFSAEDAPVDPCPKGFMLVDGVCQPVEQFGQSMYDENKDDKPDEPMREYNSIEDMKKMNDYELLNYLDDGFIKGNNYEATIGGQFGMPLMFQALFGKQNEMRRNFIMDELTTRGYALGTQDKKENEQFNVGNALGIISNAEAANQGGNRLATNQPSIFTPDEINYQIQQKNERDRTNDQQNYARSMTREQIIDNADQSGGTRNPFEMNQVNNSSPSNVGYKPSQRRNPNMNNR